MGFLPNPFRRKASAVSPVVVEVLASQERQAAALRAPPPTTPEGVSGTANYFGRLLVESNPALRDQSAYGRAGTTEWGEWAEIRRTNPFVSAGIDFVLQPIRDARIDIEAASEVAQPDRVLAQQQADFVRWNLLERLDWPAFLGAAGDTMLSAGFSLFEPLYEAGVSSPYLPGGSGYALKSLEERIPQSLHPNPWVVDEAGNLSGVRQWAPKGGSAQWVDVTLPADRLLLFSWMRQGTNWAGVSAFRAVWYIAGRVMPELLRLVGVTYQREGAGVPVVSATDAAAVLTPQQRDALATLLANLVYHENANIIMPPGWKLDWVFSPGANKGHVLEAWRQLGIVCLQQVSAQQLSLGTSDTGSRSVGETHDARSMAYVKAVVAVLESIINGVTGEPHAGLVRRLVDANWGPQPAYPKVKLTLKRAQMDPASKATAVNGAKSAGTLTWTLDDENALREELGLAPIDEETREEELERRRAMVPTSAQPPGAPTQPGQSDNPAEEADEGDEGPDAEQEGKEARLSADGFAPRRPLRPAETKLNLAAMSSYLDDARGDFERRVRPLVVEMLVRAAPAITAAMADGTPDEVASLPLDTSRLEEAVGQYLTGVRGEGKRQVVREVTKPGAAEALVEKRTDGVARMEDQKEDEAAAPEATQDADEVLDAQQKALVRRMANRLRAELEAEAIDALRTGGDGAEVVARTVKRQLDTGAFKSDAGSVITKAFNVGRDEGARLMGGVTSVEYSAILDGKQCIPCNSMDGRTAAFGSPEHDAMVPPNRDCAGGGNCRCLLAYVTQEDAP